MDEPFILLVGIASFSVVSELLVSWLRAFRSRIKRETVKKAADLVILILSCVFILGLLATFMWVSATFIYGAMAPGDRPLFRQVLLAFVALFSSSFAFVHFAGYCFAGVLNRWPLGGRFWPRAIDYVYYIFGAGVLALVLANIYGEQGLLAEATRAQVVTGTYLFSLKLFKTSYELFPTKFNWKAGWVRDPFFGKVF